MRQDAGYWPSPGLYPATLTEQTWPLKDLIYEFRGSFSCGTQRIVPSGKIARAILPARLANHSVGFGSFCALKELMVKMVFIWVMQNETQGKTKWTNKTSTYISIVSTNARKRARKTRVSLPRSGQSQRARKIQWTKQNSKTMHEADTKRGKTCAIKWRLALVSFTSDWMKKWREFCEPISAESSNVKPSYPVIVKWKSVECKFLNRHCVKYSNAKPL